MFPKSLIDHETGFWFISALKERFPFVTVRSSLQSLTELSWGIIKRFWKLPTYPSPNPTLKLTSHLGQNVGLGEG